MKIIKREKFIIGPYLRKSEYVKHAEENNLRIINLEKVSEEDFKSIYQLIISEKRDIIYNKRPFWLYENNHPNTTHCSHFMFNDFMLLNENNDYDRFVSKTIDRFRENISFLTVYEK